MFIRNGVNTAHTERVRNSRDMRSLSLCSSHAPHSDSNRTRVPKPAMIRIDQYWMNTSGT